MSEVKDWQEANTRYLSDAIAGVRALLLQRAGGAPKITVAPAALPPPPATTATTAQSGSGGFWRGLFGPKAAPQAQPAQSATAAPAGKPVETGKLVETKPPPSAPVATDMNPPPALTVLCDRLALTPFEREVLLLCVAAELDTSIGPLCARVQGDASRPYPSFALALSLFEDAAWDVLSPERPLRYWRLLEINQAAGQPLTSSPLRADERITNYLKGLSYLDDRLMPLLSPLPPPSPVPAAPATHRAAAQRIMDALLQNPAGQPAPAIQLVGADAASKQAIAGMVAAKLGRHVYRLPLHLLPSAPPDLESFARLWQRESMLLPLALYLDAQGAEGEGAQATAAAGVGRLLSRLNGLVFLGVRDRWVGLAQAAAVVDVSKPTAAEQEQAWQEALGGAAGASPAALSGQFNLNLDTIHGIAAQATAVPAGSPPLQSRLWDACLAAARPQLEGLAQRIEPKATWDDIVLPAQDIALLRRVADQVGLRSTVYRQWGFERKLSRGLGISALFAGDSGTGKTMAAEVIANHLRLHLYRIDLSAVVSKYIGETEKNLRRLFDAAEDGGAILFFDEADALFGKRSEVKDSHDRYANIEINYLLQRMESYSGLAILATNVKSALDPAFLRRLRFVMNFPFPGTAERKTMWQKAFPAGTPTQDLDYDRLARLTLAGGHIINIALNAAFAAAQSGTPVTMPLIFEAARTEFRKLERPIHEPDFRWPLAAARPA
ncbi:MAG: ATP-binding protein [Nevskia sp.]|nr:ATP-binding protein [Nevskia sp.]